MGLVERVQRWIRGSEPTMVDYETFDQIAQPAADRSDPGHSGIVGKVGPAGVSPSGGANPINTYKTQQSYDALVTTVQELRAAMDGQARRQEELFSRLSTLPQVAEALPQASKMQSDMLKMINDRLAMHAEQQRKVTEITSAVASAKSEGGTTASAKKEYAEALQGLRDQIEMGNEIDRQLVESFNRFSMMIDRLQLANQHAVDALQQVRDSYAASAMQMHEWIEKSRHRNGWLIGGAFMFALASLLISIIVAMRMAGK